MPPRVGKCRESVEAEDRRSFRAVELELTQYNSFSNSERTRCAVRLSCLQGRDNVWRRQYVRAVGVSGNAGCVTVDLKGLHEKLYAVLTPVTDRTPAEGCKRNQCKRQRIRGEGNEERRGRWAGGSDADKGPVGQSQPVVGHVARRVVPLRAFNENRDVSRQSAYGQLTSA